MGDELEASPPVIPAPVLDGNDESSVADAMAEEKMLEESVPVREAEPVEWKCGRKLIVQYH